MMAGRFTKFNKLRKSCGHIRVHRNLAHCTLLVNYCAFLTNFQTSELKFAFEIPLTFSSALK